MDLFAVAIVSTLEAEAVSMLGNQEGLSAEEEESERERVRNKQHVTHTAHCFSALILKAKCWKYMEEAVAQSKHLTALTIS